MQRRPLGDPWILGFVVAPEVLMRIEAHLFTHEKRVQTALVKIFRDVSFASPALEKV